MPARSATVSLAVLLFLNSCTRPANRSQDLLLVIEQLVVVIQDARRIVRRDRKRVDAGRRNGKAEVVADERGGARIVMAGRGHLALSTLGLEVPCRAIRIHEEAGLLGIPGE